MLLSERLKKIKTKKNPNTFLRARAFSTQTLKSLSLTDKWMLPFTLSPHASTTSAVHIPTLMYAATMSVFEGPERLTFL